MYLEGTLEILEAAEKAGKPVQVGHQKRHSLAYNRARQFVQDRENFGNVIQIESKMHGFTVFPTFYTCMLEWQCHNLDLVTSFGGPIAEIEAKSFRDSPRTGALTAMLRFESGALGILGWGTYGGPGQFSERIEVLGDQGKGVIVRNAREVTCYDQRPGRCGRTTGTQSARTKATCSMAMWASCGISSTASNRGSSRFHPSRMRPYDGVLG